MDKKILVVSISNPNPYLSKDSGTGRKPMVSYVVTGDKEAIKQFKADQIAEFGRVSEDDKGNPLFHVQASKASQYGVENTISRATSPKGEVYWFADNTENKLVEQLIAGADETTKAVFASEKIAQMRSFASTLAKNRATNIAALQAKAVADLGK